MQKIPTLFVRDFTGGRRVVTQAVTPGCEWVLAGEGRAFEKLDGTCCKIEGGVLYKRYDAKAGKKPPDGFVPAQDKPDMITDHLPGWLPVSQDDPADQYHREAWDNASAAVRERDGTYELLGPKIQGNPYGFLKHLLLWHGTFQMDPVPRHFFGLRHWLAKQPMEGLVFWRDNGDMAKIKRRDYGFPWPDPKDIRPQYGWCQMACGRAAGSIGQLCDECRQGSLDALLEKGVKTWDLSKDQE